MDDDRNYYRNRMTQEQAAADSSVNSHAKASHLDLLELYSARLRLLDGTDGSTAQSAASLESNLPVAPGWSSI